MAARRSKRGRRRNRGRFGFLYKLLSFVLILAAILVGCAVFFRVDRIEVSGNARYTQEEIIQATGVELRDNLFLLNKFQIVPRLLSRLPYIDEVVIYRDWPDTLVIEVTECQPVAAIQSGGAWWILDAKGKLLERTDAPGAAAYPEVTGLTPVTPVVGSLLEVAEEESLKLQSLKSLLGELEQRGMMGDVGYLDLTAVNEISMGYLDRFEVRLPMSGSDFGRLLRTVELAIEQGLSDTDTGILDLTLEDAHFIPYSS